MEIKKIRIKNFRGYQDETTIEIGKLTAFIGKNDIGKSTILEALDIFFYDGKGTIKIDKNDVNINESLNGNTEIIIAVCFTNLPSSIVIDSSVNTSLDSEFLLNSDGELEIVKKFYNGGSPKIYIKANHPTATNCSDLLLKKNADLKKIIQMNNINCEDLTSNVSIRSSIWAHYSDNLQLNELEIETSKEDAKAIWDKIKKYLPVYSLFQSDRSNNDGDSEIQDPLKEAVKQILADANIQLKLEEIATNVKSKLEEVSNRTMDKLREIDNSVANSLTPVIPTTESLKWQDVFKNVSISGDNNIPINKRGSGTKRLILLSFFRGEVERMANDRDYHGVIYAIEEPETSQHTNNQIKLIEALKELANHDNVQIILTTHSASIVKQLNYEMLRLIIESQNGNKSIVNVSAKTLNYSSLNEVNYIAFGEITEEYHNELYGYIEENQWLNLYKLNRPTILYNKIKKDGSVEQQNITITEYIRHQIHHPENKRNRHFTKSELKQSIDDMRSFIINQNQ